MIDRISDNNQNSCDVKQQLAETGATDLLKAAETIATAAITEATTTLLISALALPAEIPTDGVEPDIAGNIAHVADECAVEFGDLETDLFSRP